MWVCAENVQLQRTDNLGESGGVWGGFGEEVECKPPGEAHGQLTYIRKAGDVAPSRGQRWWEDGDQMV